MDSNCIKFKFKDTKKVCYLFFEDLLLPNIDEISDIFNQDDTLLCKIKHLDRLFFYSFNTKTWYPFIENVEEFLHD